MPIAIYSRKSVDTGKGESIENQIALCRDYLSRHAIAFSKEELLLYEDEGFSGKDGNRPQFQRLLRDMRAGKFSCLMCYRLDRISRSVSDFSALIEELNQRGIAFICIREQFDTSTPMGKAMLYMASVFAQLERETIAERVRDNMLLLARNGRWLGGTPPLGFVSRRRESQRGEKRKTFCVLEEQPQELALAAELFEQFRLRKSLYGVHSYFRRQHCYNRAGKPFSLPGLREILSNPVYCRADADAHRYFSLQGAQVCFPAAGAEEYGLLAYNKRSYTKPNSPRQPMDHWIVAAGVHRGLVPGAAWVAVQDALAQTMPPAAPARQINALFSGRITCAHCGKALFAKPRTQQPGRFDYICSTKLREGASRCGCPNLAGRETDRLIVYTLPFPPPSKERLLHALERQKQKGEPVELERAQRLRQKQEEAQRLVEVLTRQSPSALLVAQINQKLEQIEQEIQELHQTSSQPECTVEDAFLAEGMAFLTCSGNFRDFLLRRAAFPLLLRRISHLLWDGKILSISLQSDRKSEIRNK